MNPIPLAATPNQSLTFNVDGAFWQLHVYQAINQMYMDITRNNVPVISGIRCLGGVGLMPYKYMYAPTYGNFIFDSDADFNLFGSACNLYYLNAAEYQSYKQMLKAGYQA